MAVFFLRKVQSIFPVRLRSKRVLFVYDFVSQGYTYGDLLHCHAGSLVLAEIYAAQRVDFAFVVDRSNPTLPYSKFAEYVTADSAFFIAWRILQINLVNSKLGSTFIFDNHADLQRFVGRFKSDYVVWPSEWRVASDQFLGGLVFKELFFEFQKAHGHVPEFLLPAHLNKWAAKFFEDNVYPQTPITINLRNNPIYDVHRNSDFDAWRSFFEYCQSRYPVKFILICNVDEFDVRFRQCSNVIFAKDFHTDISQELALIANSAMHIGAGSGPVSMANFGRKPYLIVNTDLHKNKLFSHPGMVIDLDENFQKLWFAGEDQRFCRSKESANLLTVEFESMWGRLQAKAVN